MTRRAPLLLLAALAALTLVAAGCGGDDGDEVRSEESTEPSETSTTEEEDVFDPDGSSSGSGTSNGSGSGSGSDTSDPGGDPTEEILEDCIIDQDEENEAVLVRTYTECALPDVEGISGAYSDGELIDVSGEIDEGDAVEVCEVASLYVYEELGTPERTVTVSLGTDVITDEAPTVLAEREGGSADCEAA